MSSHPRVAKKKEAFSWVLHSSPRGREGDTIVKFKGCFPAYNAAGGTKINTLTAMSHEAGSNVRLP